MLIESEYDVNTPLIEDFLYVLDPAAEGEEVESYSQYVVTNEILFNSDIEPTEPQTSETTLPDFCPDRSSADDFEASAHELAAQITRTEWANYRVVEICAEQATGLAGAADAINALIEAQIALQEAQIQVNYDLTSLCGTEAAGGDLDTYILGSRTAYEMDADFVASGTGTTVTDVPAGFCDAQVYIDLQNAQDALAELERESAYAQWLISREATLVTVAIEHLSSALEDANDTYDATFPDVDGIVTDLFNADSENRIFYSANEYLVYFYSEFDSDVEFVRQITIDDLENVPTELPGSLFDQDNEIPTLLPEATVAVAEANYLSNFVEWLLSGDRLPTECQENCCEWRAMIREIEEGANGQAAFILSSLGPGVDSEANRAAFVATEPDLNKFPVPDQDVGEICSGYEEYSDRFTVATSENTFVAAFEAWCTEDPANCPAE